MKEKCSISLVIKRTIRYLTFSFKLAKYILMIIALKYDVIFFHILLMRVQISTELLLMMFIKYGDTFCLATYFLNLSWVNNIKMCPMIYVPRCSSQSYLSKSIFKQFKCLSLGKYYASSKNCEIFLIIRKCLNNSINLENEKGYI